MRKVVLVLITALAFSAVPATASAGPGTGQSRWGLECDGTTYVGSADPAWASPWGAVRLYTAVDGRLVDAHMLALPVGYETQDGVFAKPGPVGTTVACTVSYYPSGELTGWIMDAVLVSTASR